MDSGPAKKFLGPGPDPNPVGSGLGPGLGMPVAPYHTLNSAFASLELP